MFEQFVIHSPKQKRFSRIGWDEFFPYYAGYPTSFASSLISSARLDQGAIIFDPWNGSGTTTQAASKLGYHAIGCDINPVMIVVSRARCLPPSDGDSIKPLASKIIDQINVKEMQIDEYDPLLGWFEHHTVEFIRSVEYAIREYLLGAWTLQPDGTHFECMSSLAATFYVALFLTCRSLTSSFQSSNPTWLRRRKDNEAPIVVDQATILNMFRHRLDAMSNQLVAGRLDPIFKRNKLGKVDIHLIDSTKAFLPKESVDFILTSPPYCTRIDYTSATRIELAILAPLLINSPSELSRLMIGSIRVPLATISAESKWGETCNKFVASVASHRSKSSGSYYLKTHLDYFSKLSCSIDRFTIKLKPGAKAVLVVQDSYYKDIHNDLPTIAREMCVSRGLKFLGSKEFRQSRSMSGVNPYTRIYGRRPGAVESVLAFARS